MLRSDLPRLGRPMQLGNQGFVAPDDDTDARSGSRIASDCESIWRFLTDRRDAHTRANQDGPINAFRSVDHHTPADLESCHATIADLSPRCIAA